MASLWPSGSFPEVWFESGEISPDSANSLKLSERRIATSSPSISAHRSSGKPSAGSLVPETCSGPQVLVEPLQCVLPRFFGRGFVVSGRRVVMEAVIGAFVDVTFVRHIGLRQGGIEGRPPVGDPRVEFSVLRIDRRLDLGGAP